ncbi:hypothetical protein RHGRI_009604 [Rhododendron griersonianum]|uniref:Uncharacterized protein n=1 Tax=Rhododendron griersonianum TaxID=479676 RepID=A0AAV6KFE5_9ERIC|nr:hypothetical protein RHGRI_009604 [Rhododendron griersonianum]
MISCGAEIIVMAAVGLWAAGLRPSMMRFAGEMLAVMGCAVYRMIRGRPSSVLSSYLPYSSAFLPEGFYNYY